MAGQSGVWFRFSGYRCQRSYPLNFPACLVFVRLHISNYGQQQYHIRIYHTR